MPPEWRCTLGTVAVHFCREYALTKTPAQGRGRCAVSSECLGGFASSAQTETGEAKIEAHCVSADQRHAREVIGFGSITDPYAHDRELRAHCSGYDRWGVLPLAELVSEGLGSMRLPIAVRCETSG